jgi:SAM-dependent methyltransferase
MSATADTTPVVVVDEAEEEKDNVATTKIGYWEQYYAKAENAPEKPSTFALFCEELLKKEKALAEQPGCLLEVGCGNGRDAFFFAGAGVDVAACDIAEQGINKLRSKHHEAADQSVAQSGKPWFFTANFCNLIGSPIAKPVKFIYSRFTLHAIRKKGASHFLKWASDNIVVGGLIAIEARSVKDDIYGEGEAVPGEPDAFLGKTEHAEAHFRRFIRHDELQAELKQLGFEIVHEQEAAGLSPWRESDPVLSRVVARFVGPRASAKAAAANPK